MKKQSLKGQALLITGVEAVVRGLGMVMRLWISRTLGAEAVGLTELAGGVHMMALSPVASGLPGAVSRLTARSKTEEERQKILYAGKQIVIRLSLIIIPVYLMMAPFLAQWLGDERTLPSLLFFAPCVLLIGVSGVYDGYCLGNSWALPPALSELAEQVVRLAVLLSLSFLISRVTVAWRAGLAAFAGLMGEAVGCWIAVALTGRAASFRRDPALKSLRRQLTRLSLPMIVNRLSHTGLRALSGWMIPLRLALTGLSHREAMSRLGMLNGMVMPLMFLPGLLSGSLAVVGGPAAARCESASGLRRLVLRLTASAAGAGVLCAGGLYAFSPWIARHMYHLPELAPLIRALCPMAVILPIQQVLTGLMTGLGLQKQALADSLLGAAATLLCTYCWTAARGILGAGHAALVGHGLTLFCSLVRIVGYMFASPAP